MKVIGITGGIATGKSTITSFLRENGFIVIDADVISKYVMSKGSHAYYEILREFGEEVLNEDNWIDNKKLGHIVYSSNSKFEKLTEITHNKIEGLISEQIKMYRVNFGEKVIFVDAPLLIESGIQKIVDEIWLVNTEKKLQIERLMEKNKISEEEATKRVEMQIPMEEKVRYANIIINNSASKEKLYKRLLEEII
ncbi:MAG: dephospho-CoA kinase [Clostridia bacterium]|jgi:dephospho-CoA kinase|nr:dephospho-CoA kinase [Clostridia bacterium]